MTTHNYKIFFVAVLICVFCYGNARRFRATGDISLAMDIIEQEYVEKPDREKLYQAAMKGMIDSLDPYSGYIPAESLKPFQAIFDQEFGGLGISLDGPPRRDRLVVVATLYDSPAFRAGIKPGDVILKVGDNETESSTVENASKYLRGPEGTEVQLTLERSSEPSPIVVKVTRARIEVESVIGDRRRMDGRWEYLLEDDPRIAYMRLELFGEKTTQELRRALASVKDSCKGVIIDLRDNSGGLLRSATEICDLFLDDGDVVSTRGRDARIDEQYTASIGTDIASDVPIAILVNENSASASEIVAACLQDRKRAIVVGKRSYGKGSVQNVIPLDAGRAAMRLTTAYYFPPSGRMIHRKSENQKTGVWGVDPDDGCEVSMSNEQLQCAIERFRMRSDPMANGTARTSNAVDDADGESPTHRDASIKDDPQLMRAIEVLQSKL